MIDASRETGSAYREPESTVDKYRRSEIGRHLVYCSAAEDIWCDNTICTFEVPFAVITKRCLIGDAYITLQTPAASMQPTEERGTVKTRQIGHPDWVTVSYIEFSCLNQLL